MAGSEHGVKLDPEDLIGAAHAAGRPAAERDTLYGIRRRYELPAVRQAAGLARGPIFEPGPIAETMRRPLTGCEIAPRTNSACGGSRSSVAAAGAARSIVAA